MIAELKAMLDNLGTKLVSLGNAADTLNFMVKGFADEFKANYPELLPEEKDAEDENNSSVPSTSVEEYNKYAATSTSIVYEQYSNGKTFILNFNNFAVKVTVNGVSYTISAYGYIEIK
jgi:hypothetical protein